MERDINFFLQPIQQLFKKKDRDLIKKSYKHCFHFLDLITIVIVKCLPRILM